MCGIIGILDNWDKEKNKIARAMVDKMRHRGPDEDGYFDDEYVSLGMARLSIIDLSRGKQPIWSKDRRYLIIFNGEIYNFKDLREELIELGYEFITDTDTEVILHAFQEFGREVVNRLRGMFTFAIYDTLSNKIFIARDHFGIKPLYYSLKDGKMLVFGSEIKSLLVHDDVPKEVNDSAVFSYLSFQFNPLYETFFKGIFELPPAHTLEIDAQTGEFEINKYWQFSLTPDENLDLETTTGLIQEALRDSVKRHIVSDAPLGSFLSGGIDSGVNAALMKEMRNGQNVDTFTIGFPEISEGDQASITAKFIQSNHNFFEIQKNDYMKELPKAIYHFDQPVADPSAIALYFLSREARKQVKVVLSGEGADELFGGYNIYREPLALKYISSLPAHVKEDIIKPLVNLPFDFPGKNYLKRAITPVEERYIGNAKIFTQDEANNIWKGSKGLGKPIFDYLRLQYQKITGLTDSQKMQWIDVHYWLRGDILAKADKMSMAHSLELRVPFLDIEVAKIASRIPDKLKYAKGETKHALREAFRGILPESTREKKKLGFPTPIHAWLPDYKEELMTIIKNNEYMTEHFDINIIEDISNKLDQKNNARKFYLLTVLAIWHEIYFKNKFPEIIKNIV